MSNQEIFMVGYLDRWIKITFLDNEEIIGMYLNYYYFNNVIVIMPYEAHDDTRTLIPLSSIKMIDPWHIEEKDVLENVGIVLGKDD